MKIAKIASCQNCKLPKLKVISVFLLKVNIFDELSSKLQKLQDAKIESCQHLKLQKLKFGKVESDFSVFDKLNCKLLKLKVISVFLAKS